MHVQAHVKGRAATGRDHALDPRLGLWLGRCDEAVPLRLDSLGVAEYVGFHGVCFPFYELFELGPEAAAALEKAGSHQMPADFADSIK
jgi:hypothetical protein